MAARLSRGRRDLTKILMVMRLTIFLLTAAFIHAYGASMAQNVTFSGKDLSLKQVFSAVEKQTGYAVLNRKGALAGTKAVSLHVYNMPLRDFLDTVLRDQLLEYRISGKTIFISRKSRFAQSVQEMSSNQPDMPVAAPVKVRVTDMDGNPLVGASIINRNTRSMGVTDLEGVLRLNASVGDTIEVSFVGFTTRLIAVKDTSSVLNVALKPSETFLNEIVVNKGYYLTTQRLNTGSVGRVSGEMVQRHPLVNPVQALQGRVTGAYVQQTTGVPGGALNILIRGQNSLTNGNSPLYIVDGIPFGATTLSSFNASDNILPAASPLSILSSAEIESIEVLKDADATAIYGSRGANGVILITTVKGKQGKATIDVSINHGIGQSPSRLKLLDTEQYLSMRREALANDGTLPASGDYDVNGTWDTSRYTDWQKELTGGTAHITSAQVGISGGSANTQYLVSGGFYRETTVFPGENSYKKGSGKLSLTHTSSDKRLKALLSVNYATEKNDLIPYDLSMYINLPPNAPRLYDENGKLNWENGTWNNPLSILLRDFRTMTENLLVNASLSYQLYPGLLLRTNMGYTKGRRDEISTAPLASYSPFSTVTDKTISSSFADTRTINWILEPQLSWERKIGAAQLSMLAGLTLQGNTIDGERLRATGFSSDALVAQLTAANSITPVSGTFAQYRYNAGFARINYDWKNTYIINATARRDGSSRFGQNRQFANFGAIGAAWIFTNEAFLQKSRSVLSFGKLRLSYGSTGNDQIGDYNYLESWSTTSTYEGRAGLYPTRIANPDYGWEVNKKAELALELGFWNNRLVVSTAHYRNRSSNQLVSEPLPPSVGFSSFRANLPARVQNTGWEVEINSTNYQSGHFSWSTAFNISFPRNKLLAFPNLSSSIYARSYIVGEPLTIERRYNTSVDPVTGVYAFEDYDGSGDMTDEDSYLIRNPGQNYYGGLDNSITWKGWRLDFLFQFVKQEGRGYIVFFDMPGTMSNQPVDVLKRWQKPDDITDVQKYSARSQAIPHIYARSEGNMNIVDASFIRLKNLTLAYSLPAHWIRRTGMEQAKIKIQAQNVFTISAYKWSDPESQSVLRLPPLRMLNFGVQFTI